MRWIKAIVIVSTCLSVVSALSSESAMQVIAAPDKGDELEERAYVEEQKELEVGIDTRDPNATIDIDSYR
ncbi:hypothetical protein P3T76_007939 [Phytophthora citrophthora]|uniref:RxLR effector protein n=1 Tax=Phytophthora citrophthora TaxID=4793 RepID=A0AAD9GLR1_9STRA|nr:hypothetical protein P3T76_007939 [Phytophthora citrophthora]